MCGASSPTGWPAALRRGPHDRTASRSLRGRARDVDHPLDPELVGELAELVAPHLSFERHGDLGALAQLVPVAAELLGVVAAEADRDVAGVGRLLHARR